MLNRLAAATAAALALTTAATGAHAQARTPVVRHVLLLSVDGLHQSDLTYFVARHPDSALASLVARGTEFTNALTTFPSDSFPGMIAQLTGGGPGVTGVYYDDTYNPRLLPPGTLDCTSAAPGTEVGWTEAADRALTLDAGQQLADPALTALPSNTKQQTLDDAAAITAAILKLTPLRRRC